MQMQCADLHTDTVHKYTRLGHQQTHWSLCICAALIAMIALLECGLPCVCIHHLEQTEKRFRNVAVLHTNFELVAFKVAKGFSELGWVHSLRGSLALLSLSKGIEQANQGLHHMIVLRSRGPLRVSLQTVVVLLMTSTFTSYIQCSQTLLSDTLKICLQLWQTPKLAGVLNMKHSKCYEHYWFWGTQTAKGCQAHAKHTNALNTLHIALGGALFRCKHACATSIANASSLV